MDSHDRRSGAGGGDAGEVHNTFCGGTVHGSVVQAGLVEALHFHQAPPPPPPVPRQVPLPQKGFVNRSSELARLEAVVARAQTDPQPPVVLLSGLGGVGKTALVSSWVWQARDRFPDGQLYADLAEVRRDGGVDVSGVLRGFLRALGVHESLVPATLGERAAMFRTVTADRRLLVFVDNAQHAAEVRPLLPAGGMAVVTSRTRLAALVLDGAEPVGVDPLSPTAGAQLVRTWLGGARGADEEIAELVRLCGGLPLALRAVGVRLIGSAHARLDRVLAELADEGQRLGRTAGGDTTGVDSVFDAVYESFAPHTRWLYHMLGVHPGPSFTEGLASAAGGAEVPAAVGDLLDAHMATEAAGQERFRLHDLVRLHARERALSQESEQARTVMQRRITEYYLAAAESADRLVMGERFRLPSERAGGSGPATGAAPRFADGAEAVEWLDAERANLLAVLRMAAGHGWHDAVWRLCQALWALYHTRKHYADWIESHLLGIEAAQWEGRVDAEVRMRNQLARAHYELGELDRAAEELARASTLLDMVADPRLPGLVWETDGLLHLAHGRPQDAIRLFQRAKEANAQAEDRHGVVVQSYNLGQGFLQAGEYGKALAVLGEALALAEETGDDSMRSRLGIVLGKAHHATGDRDQAMSCLVTAEQWAARRGQHAKQEQALELLIVIAAETGNDELAAVCRQKRQAVLQRVAGA